MRSAGRGDPLEQRNHAILDVADCVDVDSLTGLVRPKFDRGLRVRVVGMPFQYPDPLAHHTFEPIAAVTEIRALGDVGQRADVAARVPAADLAPRGDQHDAERRVVGSQTSSHQCGIPRFEDPQRQLLAGQHRHLQREHRHDGQCSDFQLADQRVDHRAQVAVVVFGDPALALVGRAQPVDVGDLGQFVGAIQ